MMLEHMGKLECAANIRRAVDEVLAEGKVRTPDIGGTATTKEYQNAIISRL